MADQDVVRAPDGQGKREQKLCEGGGELSASILKDKLADEAFFFISPRIIGGRTAPTSCGGVTSDIRKSAGLKNIRIERKGEDILMRGEL